MLLFLIALVQLMVYLDAVPLVLAFRLRTAGGLRFGAGLGAFRGHSARRRAARALARRSVASRKRPKGGSLRQARIVWEAIRRLRVESLVVRGRVCLGNAAATALACGAAEGLTGSLTGRPGVFRLDLSPDFTSEQLSIELQGMIRIRIGQIIAAAVRYGLKNANGRIIQWIDTRLRAS